MERLYTRSLKSIVTRNEGFDEDVTYRLGRESVPLRALRFENPDQAKKLYYEPIRRKQDSLRTLDAKYAPDREYRDYLKAHNLKLRLSEEDMTAMGARLCTHSLAAKRKTMDVAEKKVYGSIPKASTPTLGKEQMKAMGERLCNGAQDKRNANLEKLEDKYLWKVKRCIRPFSPATFDRLSSRK